jgi:hypothetical protein
MAQAQSGGGGVDGFNATVQGTQWLNKMQLEELARVKGNQVFTYTYDEPERVWGADETRDTVREVREAYVKLLAEKPDVDDDGLRHRLCEKYHWRKFAKAHPLTFRSITSRDTDEKKMEYHYYMLYIMKQVETGLITQSQASAMVQAYFAKNAAERHDAANKRIPKRKV